MLRKHAFGNCSGVTLLEITFAVAIFAVAVAVAAQSLISFYANMDLQNQRIVATNHCRAIFSDMRNIRSANPNSPSNPNNFQTNILAAYPHDSVSAGPTQLTGSQVIVTYENPSQLANPLIPTVEIQWQDLRGHTAVITMTTAITDM